MSEPIVTECAEQWKPVVGWENVYEVSDLGRVRRVAPGRRTKPGYVRRPTLNRYGYMQIELCADGRPQLCTVHSLVCAAFLGPRPKGTQINHRNSNRADNRLANLEYVTQAENVRHSIASAVATGRPHRGYGQDSHAAKLNEEQVRTIRHLLSIGMPATKIAPMFGVSDKAIGKIKHGLSWKHIGPDSLQPSSV